MLSWCNEPIGANEAEDLLTASSPISRPAPFEELRARCGDERWTEARGTTRDCAGTLVNSCDITLLIEFA